MVIGVRMCTYSSIVAEGSTRFLTETSLFPPVECWFGLPTESCIASCLQEAAATPACKRSDLVSACRKLFCCLPVNSCFILPAESCSGCLCCQGMSPRVTAGTDPRPHPSPSSATSVHHSLTLLVLNHHSSVRYKGVP